MVCAFQSIENRDQILERKHIAAREGRVARKLDWDARLKANSEWADIHEVSKELIALWCCDVCGQEERVAWMLAIVAQLEAKDVLAGIHVESNALYAFLQCD